MSVLREVCENCNICQKYKITPSRPSVGLSIAVRFNQTITMDIGQYEGKMFLVMVDLTTRYIQAEWLKSKQPKEIIKALLNKWISYFGPPNAND